MQIWVFLEKSNILTDINVHRDKHQYNARDKSMKREKKLLAVLLCIIVCSMSLNFVTVFANSGEQSQPYRLSMGEEMFEFDGWGAYPANPPQSDLIKNRIYSELGINLIRIELYSDCDEGDRLIPSTFDFQNFLSFVRQAKEYKLDYMITIWTPPVSMKSNGQKNNSPEGYLKIEKEQAFCDYVVQVFDYLKEHSLPLPIAFSFANEPNHIHTYQACSYYDGQLERVLKLFDSTLEEAGYGDVLICTPEESAYSENFKTFSKPKGQVNNALLEDEDYKNAYDVLAFHGYAWNVSKNLAPIVKRSDSYMQNKEIWATESASAANLLTDASDYDTGISDILRKVNFHTQIYEANRWIYWTMFTDTGNDYHALAVLEDDGSFVTMPAYYFAKALFNSVPAGSKVAKIITDDPAYNTVPSVEVRNTDYLDIGGFKTKDGNVFTLYNSTENAKYYNISGITGNSILIYRFDNHHNVIYEKAAVTEYSYNGLRVNPGDSVIFVSGNDLVFGDVPAIGDDNTNKMIVENTVTERAPDVDSSNKSVLGTVWKADGHSESWKTSRPGLLAVRRDNVGFDDEYTVIKGQRDSLFAYTSGGPTLYGEKNWSIRLTCDLTQCVWKNVQGSRDAYTTMLATSHQPFSPPSSSDNQESFAVIITKSGRLRIAGGKNGAYFVYMADESKLNSIDFNPMGVHNYVIDKEGSDIKITIDGIELGKLIKTAHISNAGIGYEDDRVIDIPTNWGSNVTVVDSEGNEKTHIADFDITGYSPTIRYVAAANTVVVDDKCYNGSWQTSVYPGIKDLEVIEDTSVRQFAKFSDAALQVDDDYSLAFNIKKTMLAGSDITSYTVKISNGVTTESYSPDAIPLQVGRGYYSFAFNNINPANIDLPITAMLTINYADVSSSTSTYSVSVKQYCYDKLSYFSSKGTLTKEEQKLKRVIIALLNYSAAVQDYTNERLSSHELANYGLNAGDKQIAAPTCKDIFSVIDDVNQPICIWNSARSVFNNSIKVRFYADIPTNIDISTVKAVVTVEGDIPYEVPGTDFKKENGKLCFDTKNIGFLALDKPIKVQLKSNETALSKTLKYSVESYAAYHKKYSADSNFEKVVNALINLGKSISEYKGIKS